NALLDLATQARSAAGGAGSGIGRVFLRIQSVVAGKRRRDAEAAGLGFVIPSQVEPVKLHAEERSADRLVAQKVVRTERKGADPIVFAGAERDACLVVPVRKLVVRRNEREKRAGVSVAAADQHVAATVGERLLDHAARVEHPRLRLAACNV